MIEIAFMQNDLLIRSLVSILVAEASHFNQQLRGGCRGDYGNAR